MTVHTHHDNTSQETSALHTSASYQEMQFPCVFIYLHIIAFSLALRLESGKLGHLGFVPLIPYLPEEPGVMHLSMRGVVSLQNTPVSVFYAGLNCGLHPIDLKSPKDALLLGFFSRIIGGIELVPGGQPWQVCVAVCCLPPGEGGGEAAAKYLFHPQVIERCSLRSGS